MTIMGELYGQGATQPVDPKVVRAALVVLGPRCLISAEEVSSRLARTLDEYQRLKLLQKLIGAPGDVRDHWRLIDSQMRILLVSLTDPRALSGLMSY
jgi:hypothetical protein